METTFKRLATQKQTKITHIPDCIISFLSNFCQFVCKCCLTLKNEKIFCKHPDYVRKLQKIIYKYLASSWLNEPNETHCFIKIWWRWFLKQESYRKKRQSECWSECTRKWMTRAGFELAAFDFVRQVLYHKLNRFNNRSIIMIWLVEMIDHSCKSNKIKATFLTSASFSIFNREISPFANSIAFSYSWMK